jgi:hypothetical protein
MQINSISDFITYLLSLFIPEVKKDWEITSTLEEKLNFDNGNDNEYFFINKNFIPLAERH